MDFNRSIPSNRRTLMIELLWTKIPFIDIPVLVIVAVIGVWFLLRNRATKLESSAALDARIGAGHPIVVEFFSNT